MGLGCIFTSTLNPHPQYLETNMSYLFSGVALVLFITGIMSATYQAGEMMKAGNLANSLAIIVTIVGMAIVLVNIANKDNDTLL
jgi:uncharacterized membrane protein YjfL (UPF0719 family)